MDITIHFISSSVIRYSFFPGVRQIYKYMPAGWGKKQPVYFTNF